MSTPAPVVAQAAFTLALGDVHMDVSRIETPSTVAAAVLPEATTVAAKTAAALQTARAVLPSPDPWWHLYAPLHYIATQTIGLAYSEQFQGTYDAVLKKAQGRITELADLKARHDAVHIRVNDMSAGK